MEVVSFNDEWKDRAPSQKVILVRSSSNPNKVYQIRCGPYECSCPAYQRFSAPWFEGKTDRAGNPLGESYMCKHMKYILNKPIPEKDMLAVLKATDGDIKIFTKNWSYSDLLILYFRQLIIFDENKEKVIVL